MANIDIFNQTAKKYDAPDREIVNQKMISEVTKYLSNETEKQTFIDYGCGTGVMGLALADQFEKVYLLDPATEMLKVVDGKIQETDIQNAETHLISENEALVIRADVIVMAQVLLHIPEYEATLKVLFDTLKPGGELLIIDFDYHEKVNSDLVHSGFVQADLIKKVQAIGFGNVQSQNFYTAEALFMKERATLFCLRATKSFDD